MNLVGNLEDLPLNDILQIVHLSRQTGCLEITAEGQLVNLHFKQGKVVDASAPGSLSRAFQLLQRRGLLEEEEALRLMRDQPGADIGWADRVLTEGLVSAPLLEQARGEWIKAEISHLLEMRTGEFIFRLAGAEGGAPAMNPQLGEGVSPQAVTSTAVQFGFSAPVEAAIQAVVPDTVPPQAPFPAPIEAMPSPGTEQSFADDEDVPLLDAFVVEEKPVVTTRQKLRDTNPGMHPIPAPGVHHDAALPADLRLDGVTVGLALADLALAEWISRTATAAGAKVQRLPPEQIRTWMAHATPPVALLVDALLPGGLDIARMAEKLQPGVPVITLLPTGAAGIAERAAGLRHLVWRPDPAHIPLIELEGRIHAFAIETAQRIQSLLPRDEMSDMATALGAESGTAVAVSDPMGMLRALIGELQSYGAPEVSLLILRLAAEYLERAVLLLVTQEELLGIGGFGATGVDEPMATRVRRIHATLEEMPELARIAASVRAQHGPLSPELQPFLSALGELQPAEGVFLPVTSRGKVFAILYGDNAVSGAPIGDMLALELFAAQAGIALENAMLEKQLAESRAHGG